MPGVSIKKYYLFCFLILAVSVGLYMHYVLDNYSEETAVESMSMREVPRRRRRRQLQQQQEERIHPSDKSKNKSSRIKSTISREEG
jgi:hypothetical protein